jgi:squalene-hopene/tetraprenyl-beta-curcumene cyclase
MLDRSLLAATREQLLRELRADRGAAPHWTGELANSSLSTATALSALILAQRGGVAGKDTEQAIAAGLDFLARQQLGDGGFGDTDRSRSNIATTFLVLSAWKLAGNPADAMTDDPAAARAWEYVNRQGGWAGLRARYGKDRTFVVPILTNCALAGLVDWRKISALPFELACLPQSVYRFLQLPVVSYAIPALVAMGQARHFHAPSRLWPVRWLRSSAIEPSLRVLRAMQPASGGYLEATPLTAFVVMSLLSCDRGSHPVVQDGLRFLRASQRADGGWPIDTNLATWVTSLCLLALADCDAIDRELDAPAIDWLGTCQHQIRHRFTGAAPGGWGWSDLSGAVPDADDTPAALLALHRWQEATNAPGDWFTAWRPRVESGIHWLLDLQNRDGGWPTFCRGWGALPFDRSSSDLTAHALRALHAWSKQLEPRTRSRAASAIARGRQYLLRQQQPDGSWLPLWFGNQDLADETNPWYGTARVLSAFAELGWSDEPAVSRAVAWLRATQNADGGWGGGPSVEALATGQDATKAAWRPPGITPQSDASRAAPTRTIDRSTVEETSLVLGALADIAGGRALADANIIRGVDWLCQAIRRAEHRRAWPIGFYFAKLWYYERLYPIVFAAGAIGRWCRLAEEEPSADRQPLSV